MAEVISALTHAKQQILGYFKPETPGKYPSKINESRTSLTFDVDKIRSREWEILYDLKSDQRLAVWVTPKPGEVGLIFEILISYV